MKVKNRSLKSITKWGLGRCQGKLKGYKRRMEDVAATIKITDSIGYLSDDLLVELATIGIKLRVEESKTWYRIMMLKNPNGDWSRDEASFDNNIMNDWQFFMWTVKSHDLYSRYRKILFNRRKASI